MRYEYDASNGGFRPEQGGAQPPEKNDAASWVLIAAMFLLGLWPIGLVLLISKLSRGKRGKKAAKNNREPSTARKSVEKVTRTPADSTKSARVMKTVGIVLMVLGGVTASQYVADLGFYINYGEMWWFFKDMFPAIGILFGGIALVAGGEAMTRRIRRFSKYLAAAGKSQSVSISRLAKAAEVKEQCVEKDLEEMIDKGLWGEDAYLDLGAGKLFRSAEAADEYFAKESEPEQPKETEEGYSGLLRQIRNANDRIADPTLSAKIDRLEEVAGRIFRLVENQPEKKVKASTFLNYYLPTTQKLLDSYAEFEEAGVSGENLNQAKAKIRKTMDNIVAGFERQLDELYRTDALDIDSDIRVMESMLRRDRASAAEDFGLDNSGAVQQASDE